MGNETILYRDSKNNRLKLGIRYTYRDEGPDKVTYYKNGEVIDQISSAHQGVDKTAAIFLEEEYSGLKNTVLTVGGRLDNNNYRDKSTIFLPRASVYHKLMQHLSVKYAFNSGYIRPSVRQSRGGEPLYNTRFNRYEIGADKSQKANMNDLQFSFNTASSLFNVNFYHSVIKDNIIFVGITGVTAAGDKYSLTQINTNNLTSKGIELDFRSNLRLNFTLYGNYSFSDAEYNSPVITASNSLIDDVTVNLAEKSFIMKPDDLTRTGAPRHIWNTGLIWDVFSWTSFNLHYRGWNTTWVKWNNANEFKLYGPEHYLDCSLFFKNFIKDHFELSISAFNILNNDNNLPNLSGKGYVEAGRARWDIQLRMKL